MRNYVLFLKLFHSVDAPYCITDELQYHHKIIWLPKIALLKYLLNMQQKTSIEKMLLLWQLPPPNL